MDSVIKSVNMNSVTMYNIIFNRIAQRHPRRARSRYRIIRSYHLTARSRDETVQSDYQIN